MNADCVDSGTCVDVGFDIIVVVQEYVACCCLFFFSSRRRHTRFDCDWSSDVCSSDLTTLLRACAGLVGIASGEAEVLGHDLRRDRRAVRRRVGLLGHTGSLYEDLTVADNLLFAARAVGADRRVAEDAMVRLGLDGRLRDVPVAKLSAGPPPPAAGAPPAPPAA